MAVVVGYVPTAEGRAALRRAAEECARRRAPLVIVHSVGNRNADAEEAARQEAELQQVCADLEAQGVSSEIRRPTGKAEPAENLLSVAAQLSADVIVIGLRRRTPVGKLILGSNAQRILLDAPCPVLAVKADAPAPG